MNGVQDEIQRLLDELNALRTELQNKPAMIQKDFDVDRAIQLTNMTKELVAKEHMCDHGAVACSKSGGNLTTVGISFDDKSGVVSNILVGGPAFNSKKVFKSDIICSVDGNDVNGNAREILALLKGVDLPGSSVTIGFKRASSGEIEEVLLRRMANTQIADKRLIFELFTKLIDGARKRRDQATEGLVQQALDLWTAEMLEQYEHDEKCLTNVHDMQNTTDDWLEELLQILQGSETLPIKKEAPKAQRSAPPSVPLISKEELERLKRELQLKSDENEDLKIFVSGGKEDIDKLQQQLIQLQHELTNANASLEQCAATADQQDADNQDLRKKLAALQSFLDANEAELKIAREQLAKDLSDLAAKDAEITELKKKLVTLEVKVSKGSQIENEDLEKLQRKLAQLQEELSKAEHALE